MDDTKKRRIKNVDQLCWDCVNACGGCEWSSGLEPVPGWTAKATRRTNGWKPYIAYEITACPKFERG